jgi:hypothetical protein
MKGAGGGLKLVMNAVLAPFSTPSTLPKTLPKGSFGEGNDGFPVAATDVLTVRPCLVIVLVILRFYARTSQRSCEKNHAQCQDNSRSDFDKLL